jgi:hypothetical protein
VNFSYSPERLEALKRSISPERLTHYMAEAANDLEAAIRLYQLNARLSAALYGPLQGLEVTVRNAMNDQLCATFGDTWHDLTVIRLEPRQRADVQDAVREAEEVDADGKTPTMGAVIAELRFAFWVGILGPRSENELWRKALYRAFPHRPKGVERKRIHGALNSLRRLRNRIAHHARILHRDLVADHELILEVTGWACPVTRDWIASHSTFDPNDLPVRAITLPMDGVPEVDPVAPSTPPRDARGGRPILSIKK